MIHRPSISGPTRVHTGLSLAAWGLASFVVTLLAAAVILRLRGCRGTVEDARETFRQPEQAETPEPFSPFHAMVFPTDADILSPTNAADVFMPTASGNPESALFGSARTGSDGRPRFHAGVDIAPRQRDRRGRPLDAVRAIVDGRVAYVNRVGGDSSYGIYVVLLHDDPVGTVYSLYAHLASVPSELRPGVVVQAGAPVGVMGNSANTGIPVVRAHLHLEIGVMLSDRFGVWTRAKKLKPDRGNYHGWNLFAVDPLDVFAKQRATGHFSMAKYLTSAPTAFELLLQPKRFPGYFRRHRMLWQGTEEPVGPMVLRVSEGGVILQGRPADERETATFNAVRKPVVQNVDEGVLGRNGMRIVAKVNGRWTLGSGATRWLELLTY